MAEVCVPGLIAEQAKTNPNDIALVDTGYSLTYRELDVRSGELAGILRSRGITRGGLVGIHAQRSIPLVVGALAAMKAGGAYLPLDPSNPKDRLAFQLADSQAVVLVAAESAQTEVMVPSGQILLSDRDGKLIGIDPAESFSECVSGEDLAYVIYTSGSTGRPKGVEITHASLSNLICWHREAFDVTRTDRASYVSGVGFDAGVWELWPYLAAGATVCVAANSVVRDPETLKDWLIRQEITISFTPTAMAERLMELDWPSDVPLRIMLTGGDRLHRRPTPRLPFQVVNNYGPTECTVVATSGIMLPEADSDPLPAIGRPIANTTIHILDDEKRPVQPGEPGEIWIGGRGVARGYRNDPELTAQKFIPNPFDAMPGARLYRTGDRGRLLPDGQIAFLGRTDDQVKVRGFRIEPGEIEMRLNQHPSVRESAVVARENDSCNARLVAFVVLKSVEASPISEIQSFLRERLPLHMIPTEFQRLTALPIGPNGKVDRLALQSLNSDSGWSENGHIGPRTKTEEIVAQIVAALLKRESVSVTDDFFMLGGHSLLGAQLIARINQKFHVKLPLSTLLETRTIEGLAKILQSQESPSRWTSLVALQPRGRRPPIFCVHPGPGDVFSFREFPKYLGDDQPVYALQSRGLTGGAPHFDVRNMARHYVSELRTVQPEGPYSLVGLSFGGLVAFEMAQTLLQQGQDVAFLGMWYTPQPEFLEASISPQVSSIGERIARKVNELRSLGAAQKLKHLSLDALYLSRIVSRAVKVEMWRFIAGKFGDRAAEQLGKYLPDLHYFHIAAAENYRPERTFPGRITLFLPAGHPFASAASADGGWNHFAGEGIELVEIPAGDRAGAQIAASAETVCNVLKAAVESYCAKG
jgi:amino acid adenylation domain-containing protein